MVINARRVHTLCWLHTRDSARRGPFFAECIAVLTRAHTVARQLELTYAQYSPRLFPE